MEEQRKHLALVKRIDALLDYRPTLPPLRKDLLVMLQIWRELPKPSATSPDR